MKFSMLLTTALLVIKTVKAAPTTNSSLAGSWLKTKGACRYSDGLYDTFAPTTVTSHDACKKFCIKNSKCDAFDTDGSACHLFQNKNGKKHTGDGDGLDFCYIRAAKVSKTCSSVGDPHIVMFNGVGFDTHQLGWKTLYAKGNLTIDLHQATWTNHNGACNSVVRYSVDGGANWRETLANGTTLRDGHFKIFTSPLPDVKLTVTTTDFGRHVPLTVHFSHLYNVYVTTTDWAGATGQCNQAPALERRLGGSDSSGGIAFPTGTAVKVSKQQAEQACGALKDQKDNCITDLRMVNGPGIVKEIVQHFVEVEDTVEKLVTTGTCPNSYTFVSSVDNYLCRIGCVKQSSGSNCVKCDCTTTTSTSTSTTTRVTCPSSYTYVGPGGLFMCPSGCLIKSLPGSNSKCMKCDCLTSTTTAAATTTNSTKVAKVDGAVSTTATGCAALALTVLAATMY